MHLPSYVDPPRSVCIEKATCLQWRSLMTQALLQTKASPPSRT